MNHSAENDALVEKGAEALFYHFHGRDGLLNTGYTWPAPEQHLPWWRAAAAAVIDATHVTPPAVTSCDCGDPAEFTPCRNDFGERCASCHVAGCRECQDDLADQDAAEARSDGIHT